MTPAEPNAVIAPLLSVAQYGQIVLALGVRMRQVGAGSQDWQICEAALAEIKRAAAQRNGKVGRVDSSAYKDY